MSLLQNNENEVPVGLNASRSNKTFKILHENKVEKRPRPLKTQAGKRAVLGDVTNKISIKKTTMDMAKKKVLQVKRPASSLMHHPTTSTISSSSSNSSSVSVCISPVRSIMSAKMTTESMEVQEVPELSEEVEEEQQQEEQQVKSPLCLSNELDSMLSIDEELHDIDSIDKKDANACWQYAEDITKYQLITEKQRMTNPSYMSKQSDINSKMRAILIDWLVDVHCKYDLLPQTLHIAIHLIDRHLEKDLHVPRQRLQLVGVTALFIASKYEEIYPPEAEDFVRITDNAYTRDEVFSMEEELLANVGYRITFPTAYSFLQRFLKASKTCDDRVQHFSHYVIDRSLQEYKMIKYSPSMIASCAVHIAKSQMNDIPAWTSCMVYHSSYAEKDLSECIDDLKEMLWNAQNGVGKTSKLTAVRRKFEKEKFMAVSTHPLVLDDNL